MGLQSYDWNRLYDRAQAYLQRYDPEIQVDRNTQTFFQSPQVDASFPLKGKKLLLEKLKKDTQIRIRRGFCANGVRHARISVVFALDGTIHLCGFRSEKNTNEPDNRKEERERQTDNRKNSRQIESVCSADAGKSNTLCYCRSCL